MSNARLEQFDKAVQLRGESIDLFIKIWKEYHLYSTLEFWIMVSVLVVPLFILFFKIDKSKIFLIGFYGYSVHVILAYGDIYGMNSGYWHYPFQLVPALPSISVDASIVPVVCMLMYQWTLNNNKNYYLYAILTAGAFALVFKPLLVGLGLFKLYGKANYIYLFVGYVLIFTYSKIHNQCIFVDPKKIWTSNQIILTIPLQKVKVFFMGKCVKEGIIYIPVELVKLVFLQTIKEEEREVYHPLDKVVELLNRGI
ncbi:CBO0543 family protein [Bacillus coreaensis]